MARTRRKRPSGESIAAPAKISVTLTVNGVARELAVAPWVTLLDALRDRLGLTGTKKGCDHGQCGGCTVLVDGRRINSCMTFAVMQDGAEVTTVEGLARDGGHDLARRAIAALESVAIQECLLDRVQHVTVSESLDGRDLLCLRGDCQR